MKKERKIEKRIKENKVKKMDIDNCMHLVKKDGRGFYRHYKEVEYVKGSKMLNIGDKMNVPGIVPPPDYKFKLWDPVLIRIVSFLNDGKEEEEKEREENERKRNGKEIWVRGSVYSTEKNGRINVKCMNVNAKDFYILSVPVSEVLLSSNMKS